MNVFDEFLTIARELERHGIAYAVVGGVSLAFHGIPRTTQDIDLLVPPQEAQAVAGLLESLGYFESAEPWTFSSTAITLRRFMKVVGTRHLLVDVMVGNESSHRDIVDRSLVAESHETVVRVARKEDLVWLKRQRNSLQDQADIERLSDDEDRTGPAGLE